MNLTLVELFQYSQSSLIKVESAAVPFGYEDSFVVDFAFSDHVCLVYYIALHLIKFRTVRLLIN